jgi:hypothetical protein
LNLLRVFINLFQFNRTNWKAVTLCLLTATVFWFFNSLNKNHSTIIRFPLTLLYDQQKFVPASALPQEIAINVNGNGWDLFRKHFGLKVPNLTVPLDKPTEITRLSGASLVPIFASQIGNLNINYVVTDSLHIQLDEKFSRKFRLTGDLSESTFKNGFGRISPLIILPDSVTLSGPKKVLLHMPDSITLAIGPKNLDQNFREQVEVSLGGLDFISRNPPVVDVMFEVGPMVQVEKWVKLKLDRMTWGVEIEKDTIRAVFEIPERDMEAFRPYTFTVNVPAEIAKKGETKFIKPSVNDLPLWAKLIYIDSVKVRRY